MIFITYTGLSIVIVFSVILGRNSRPVLLIPSMICFSIYMNKYEKHQTYFSVYCIVHILYNKLLPHFFLDKDQLVNKEIK